LSAGDLLVVYSRDEVDQPACMWLLLDTALPRAVVAVVANGGDIKSEVLLDETRRHAEHLGAAVDDALAAAGITIRDISGIGAGIGPGSFIGVRTGLSYARGLGSACGVDVVGVSSLLALHRSVAPELMRAHEHAVVVIDARRGERYVGHVKHNALSGVIAAVPNAMVDAAGATLAIGATDELQWPATAQTVALPGPTAAGMWQALQTAQASHAPPLPVYVRGADAKLPAVDPAARREAVLADLDAHDAQRTTHEEQR
jgi:tRNA threonylcarbamoyladenosine biosynthesis protein TsaB